MDLCLCLWRIYVCLERDDPHFFIIILLSREHKSFHDARKAFFRKERSSPHSRGIWDPAGTRPKDVGKNLYVLLVESEEDSVRKSVAAP